MPSNRFFVDSILDPSVSVLIEGAELHHLAHVMRLGLFEEVELVNGRGDFAIGKIFAFKKQAAHLEILESSHAEKPLRRIGLGVPFMRSAKIEWIVEKGTELGVDVFYFYEADHSEKEQLAERKQERLRTLSVAALKQSGRLHLPSFEILSSLSSFFSIDLPLFFGDPRADRLPFPPLGDDRGVLLITGPEQGFSHKERQLLQEKAQGVLLSKNILRAETAAIAAASFLGLMPSAPLHPEAGNPAP